MNKSAEIFKPGALPVTTYISREAALGFTYEERLTQNRKGQYAVDLVHPYRLVFEKNGDEIQIANILEIVDYH